MQDLIVPMKANRLTGPEFLVTIRFHRGGSDKAVIMKKNVKTLFIKYPKT